jgi:hypothetical protein
MFMKTIAVGPFELVASCVTGGARVCAAAMFFFCCHGGAYALANLEVGQRLVRSNS